MNRSWVLVAALAAATGAQAQSISIAALGTPVTVDFNTLVNTGTQAMVGNSPINGVYVVRTGTGVNLVANNGASNAGNAYSYGTGTDADRALGSVGSGNASAGNFFFGVLFQNNSGAAINSLTVNFVGEQWRNGGNTNVHTMAFSHVTGATPGLALADFQAGGTSESLLNFDSLINTATAATLDGNLAANRIARSATLTFAAPVANGEQILLRWSDPDQAGSDHGLAIDDLVVTANGAPVCVTNPVVTNTNDAGAGSLRQAVIDACVGSTITFDGGVFFSGQTITLTTGQLTRNTDLTIQGNGNVILSGNNSSRILELSGGTVRLSELRFINGNSVGVLANGGGGAVAAIGTNLIIERSVFTGNSCVATGGAIFVGGGTVAVTDSTITANPCGNVGGIYIADALTTISDSTISDHTTVPAGEAIRFSASNTDATLNLVNSTIAGNRTTNAISGLRVQAAAGRTANANVVNCTITDNQVTNAGFGAIGGDGSAGTMNVTLTNTIVIGNTSGGVPADAASALVASSSNNLIGVGGGLTNGVNGNQVGVAAADALLSAPGDFGGPTDTIALLPGSPAIDAGTSTGAPATDQRGLPRDDGQIDIGAFETEGFNLSLFSGDNQSTPVLTAFPMPLVVQISAIGEPGGPVVGGRVTFVPPGSGASASVLPVQATIDSDGFASTVATANGIAGDFDLLADTNGVSEGSFFFLTNQPGGQQAQFAITNASLIEGNAGLNNLQFTVTASPAPSAPATVDFATTNGSATAGSDYTTTNGTLPFATGQASAIINVPVAGDLTVEGNETLTLTLSNASGPALIYTAIATGTITNDDSAVINRNAPSVNEGNAGTTPLPFTFTLSAPVQGDVTVAYNTADGSATLADNDYAATSGQVVLPGGSTAAQTVNVLVTGDTAVEPNETLQLGASVFSVPAGVSPASLSLSTASATGTILNDDSNVTVQFTSATYAAGEAAGTALITVTASPAPAAQVQVSYTTSNGTAVAGTDYTTAAGTLTFGVGVASQTFTVPITNDTTVEANETVNLALSAPTGGATLGTISTAVLTLNNDDSTAVTVSAPSVTEGNVGTTPLPFQVSLSNPVQGAITLDYASADGNNVDPLQNATVADNDYQAATGSVSFPTDSTAAQTVNVAVVGDTDVEPNQQLRLQLSNLQIPAGLNPASFNLANASGVGTINNDDGTTLSVNSPTQAEGNAAGTLAFTVTLGAANKTPVTVNYATGDGTATAGSDYTATSGTLTFTPGGALTQTVSVPTTGDTIVEANETFTLTLSNPSGATLGTAVGTGTLTNDDTATLSLNAPSVTEGNAGNTPMTFTATLSAAVQGTVSATVNTADGNNATATLNATVADNDYVPVVNGTVNIASGTTATSVVQVVGDVEVEPNQGLRLILSNLQVPAGIPAGAVTLGTATGNGTINNDDSTTLSIAPASIPEGNAGTSVLNLVVTLGAPSKTPVTVNFATSNGTATAGSDYVAASGTLTFASGVLTQSVPVTVNGDATLEADETFTVTLSAPSGATLGTASATGTITNDDAVSLSVADTSAPEGSTNTSPGQLRFVVTLNGTSSVPVTVGYSTAPGSAGAGLDYTSVTGSLTFAPGTTSQVVTVAVLPDMLNEPDETLSFTLANPQPGAPQVILARATATGTIVNDDFVTQIPATGARGILLLLALVAGMGLFVLRLRR